MAARSESKQMSHFSKKPMHALLPIIYSIRYRLPYIIIRLRAKKKLILLFCARNCFYQACDDIDRCHDNGT
jgi:hypothetical protein